MDEQEGGAGSPVERRVLLLLLGAVLAGFTGQQLLGPVLPPLSRELGLGEVQLGFVITSAAVVFTLASLFWGRVCDRWGQRRVLLTGLTLCTAGLAGFAAVSAWALGSADPSAATVLTGMILMRSVLFGFGVGAIPVAALAYVGAGTAGEAERTRAVSMVGAVQALALVLGPGVGGLLAAGTLLGPLYLAPVVLGLITVVVAVVLPRPTRSGAAPLRLAPPARTLSPFDPRLRRFLAVGFMLFLSLGTIQVVLGFLFQDRLGLDGTATAATTGAAGFATGLVLVAVQGGVVPRLGWGPLRLLRVGAPIAAAGFAVVALGPEFWSMTAGSMVVALGLGMAIPGYTAGPTLAVGRSEQGAVAGLINATNGSTFIAGPLIGTALYAAGPALPVVLSCLLCVAACALLVRPIRQAVPDAGVTVAE
ncbi:putative MFS family arabinose efflux permease [Pseudonocardia hierapolitana]|uniref:Putative MFS family arabinose efflux permease n=1 Tax=Pseudonocardia hierapolitana TaxID=1128676 RepID=A0A561T0Z2_9PSEU|nr:MFS transporter [Pseudonocardia hierapolitana]TWF80771.1 putative MFS family arabinose efflux permease [Pseudonocardia hierapolitana]